MEMYRLCIFLEGSMKTPNLAMLEKAEQPAWRPKEKHKITLRARKN